MKIVRPAVLLTVGFCMGMYISDCNLTNKLDKFPETTTEYKGSVPEIPTNIGHLPNYCIRNTRYYDKQACEEYIQQRR